MSSDQPPNSGPWQQPSSSPWQQPGGGPGQQQPGSWQSQPEWVSGGPAGAPAPRRRKRGLAIGAGAGVLAIMAGVGIVYAYQTLSGGGPQPAEAVPASAVAYLRLDLDPSAAQKVNAFRLLRSVPDFEKSTGISSDKDDLRRLVYDAVSADLNCGLSYDQDIAPWIGDRAAVAVVPVDDTATGEIVLQVKDSGKAKAAVPAIEKCAAAQSGSTLGVDFVGDYMVMTESKYLDSIVSAAGSSPLSGDSGFTSDMSSLGEQGIASFWYDIDGAREIPQVQDAMGGSGFGSMAGVHSVFGAARAGSDYLELAVQARADQSVTTDVSNPVANLPDTTMAAASVSGGGQLLTDNWDKLVAALDSASGGQALSAISSFESSTGLSLPDDAATLLGDNVTLALDGEGFTSDALSSQNPFDALGFGARFTTDPQEVQHVIDTLQSALSAQGAPIQLITRSTSDGLVVASNDGYAGQLAADGNLGSSDTFTTAVPNASSAAGVLYVDMDKLGSALAAVNQQDAADKIAPLRAVGLSVQQLNGDTLQATLRVTFDG